MADWAYACHACDDDGAGTWYVPATLVAELPPEVRILKVKVGDDWRCALVDRTAPVAIDRQLLHLAYASSEEECPACRAHRAANSSAAPANGAHATSGAAGEVQAAAIALQGRHLVVVLVGPDLLASPAEAELALETLAHTFGGAPVVLMAQAEDGSPRYFGAADLLLLLEGVPVERMPWKTYPLR